MDRIRTVRMKSEELRTITLASKVPDVLEFQVRRLRNGQPFPSVSVVGLWSCTGTRENVNEWFAVYSARHGLIHNRDWVGVLNRDVKAAFLHVSVAHYLLTSVRTEASMVAVRIIAPEVARLQIAALGQKDQLPEGDSVMAEEAIVLPREGAGVAKAPDTLPADGSGDAPVDASASDEPWAEAFDFGRLVPVADHDIGGEVQPTVSARDVHTFLNSSRWFGNWFDHEVGRLSLVQDLDYALQAVSNKNVGNPRGGRPQRESRLTLAAAKKIAMAASGLRGVAVREYFIESERRLLAGEGPVPGSFDPMPAIPADAATTSLPHPRPVVLAPCMPASLINLTMFEFFCIITCNPVDAKTLAGYEGLNAVHRLMLDGYGASIGLNPVTKETIFARPALDYWWALEGRRILEETFSVV